MPPGSAKGSGRRAVGISLPGEGDGGEPPGTKSSDHQVETGGVIAARHSPRPGSSTRITLPVRPCPSTLDRYATVSATVSGAHRPPGCTETALTVMSALTQLEREHAGERLRGGLGGRVAPVAGPAANDRRAGQVDDRTAVAKPARGLPVDDQGGPRVDPAQVRRTRRGRPRPRRAAGIGRRRRGRRRRSRRTPRSSRRRASRRPARRRRRRGRPRLCRCRRGPRPSTRPRAGRGGS